MAGGPSVVVKVLGDLKGLTTAFTGAGDHAQSVSTRMRTAFAGVTSGLNQTGILGPFQGVLDGINTTLDTLDGKAKGLGTKLMGAGGAALGVGAGLTAFGSKDQAAQQQLKTAIENTGGSYEDYSKSVEDAIGHQEKYGHTADETQNALEKLTEATHDPQKALDLLGEASDIASAKHEDLSTAAEQLGKVYNGNTKLLKPFGVEIDKVTGLTKDGKTAVQALADVTKGQASAATDTFMGKLDGLKAHLEDSIAQFGQKWGPAIQVAGVAMLGLGSAIEVLPAIFGALSTAWGVLTGIELASLGPILLIIAAVAALIAIAWLLYNNWDTIWSFIQSVISGVWDWISTHWPLLLAILTGPIGIAVLIIVDHWDTIKAAFQAAFDFIVSVWSGIVGFFSGIWDGIRNAATAAAQWVVDRWNDTIGFFQGLPGRIAGALSGMWDFLSREFKNVIDSVIDLWNGLHIPSFSIGGWSTPFGDLPSWDTPQIDFPDIPRLAQGGLITQTGFVFAHAGEAITPLPAGRLGPLVSVENLNLSDEVDVDLFTRKVAWMARTQAV